MRLIASTILACMLALPAAGQTVSVSLPEGHEFTNPDREPFALSPDGANITYLARATLFIKPVRGGEPTFVQGPLRGRPKSNPIYSPDGQSILYWATDDSVLQRVPVRGGTPVTLGKIDPPLGLSWGADDQVLVGGGASGVLRLSARGGAVETLVKMNAGESARSPQMLPGGDAVLFTVATGSPANWDQARIVVQSTKTGQRTVVGQGRDGKYLSSGHLVYADGTSLVAVAFDPRSAATSGQPVTIATGVQSIRETGAALFSVAPNGTLAFAPNDSAPIRLERVGLDGKRQVLGNVPEGTLAPRVSADGKKVAFAAASVIYVADIDNVAGARKVISNGTFPLFSPDGQWLAFGSLNTPRDNGEERIFMQRSDGSGEAQLVVKPGRAPENWRSGPQGFSFISHRGGANNYDLWFYAPDKKEVEPLAVVSESAQLSSSMSPDGKWVAYMSSESGDWQIYVQPYPLTGEKFQVTRKGGRSPMWTSDGRIVYDSDGRLAAVSVQPGPKPSFGESVELPVGGHIQPLLRRNWDMMPDGKSMLMLFRAGPKINVVSGWADKIPTRSSR